MSEDRTQSAVFDAASLQQLVSVLIERGYRVVGPTLRDNAIVLAELESADDLPRGWGVDVGPGQYRIRRRDDAAVFGHSAGPQSWKQFLHPPRQRLWSGTLDATVDTEPEEIPRYAFLGVRGCDLAAIATLDRVLGGGAYPDRGFVGRRRQIFVVAVNCTEPGGLCFCASMGTGPAAGPGYDLALTELLDGDEPGYLVDVGSEEGAEVLAAVPHRAADAAEIDGARTEVSAAAHRMGREMPSGDLRELLVASRESPHWEEVASRCLTCGNCTMVCPTCFCTSTEDVTDLTGEHAERWSQWASCFEFDFTFVHEGSVGSPGPRATALELQSLARVREQNPNLHLMIPFVRTRWELEECLSLVDASPLGRQRGLHRWVVAEVPSVVHWLPEYVGVGIDGVSIGSNDMTQLMLGVDRDSDVCAELFDESDPAVLDAIGQIVGTARKLGIRLATAVAVALLAASTIATVVALALPWLLQRLGKDPAFGSGPLATVIQDLLSIVIYLAAVTVLLT